MKTFLLFICFLYVTFSSLFAQVYTYQPFPVDGGVWNYYQTNYCMPGSVTCKVTIKANRDTLISGRIYRQLNTTSYSVVSGTMGCYSDVIKYFGSIRHDQANRKVYIVPPGENIEVILYDFTLQVGEPLQGHLSLQRNIMVSPQVVSIDTVIVGNSRRKRWKLATPAGPGPLNTLQIVEGIGAVEGLTRLANGMSDSPQNAFYYFDCINNTGLGDCDIVLNTPKAISAKQINVFPNPFVGQFQISGLEGEAEKLIIRDIQGKTIETISAGYVEKFSGYGPGIYLLEVRMKNGSSTVKRLVGLF